LQNNLIEINDIVTKKIGVPALKYLMKSLIYYIKYLGVGNREQDSVRLPFIELNNDEKLTIDKFFSQTLNSLNE
jgi:hypothetical protein